MRRLPDDVAQIGPDDFNAVLEVWNTGDKAVKLAERPNVSGQNFPSNEWLVGLNLLLTDSEGRTHRFDRADNKRRAWSIIERFNGDARLIQPGEKVRFKIRLHGLVERLGMSLLNFRGRYQLQPVLQVGVDLKPPYVVWRGMAVGKAVRVELGSDADLPSRDP